MSGVFSFVLSRAVSVTWLIAVVLILRLCLKKSPKWLTLILWALVAVRLVLPVSLPSVTSLIPQETADVVKSVQTASQVQTLVPQTLSPPDTTVTVIGNADAPTTVEVISSLNAFAFRDLLPYLWLSGVAGMLLYGLAAYLRMKRRVSASVLKFRNLYTCDEVKTPFILGIFRPRIYIPSFMEREKVTYVAMHERAHIRHLDHVWKVLGFALLSVYWFHPLLWLSYVLFCRDMELACDERVVKLLDRERRADYSQTLLSCALPAKKVLTCPLAFGEVGVKERVKNVLSYKKPAFWVILVAILLTVVVAVCFLTDPLPGSDCLKFVQSTPTEATNEAEYKVQMGNEVNSMVLQTELWQNGQCEYGAPFVLAKDTTSLKLLFSEEKTDYALSGMNLTIKTNTGAYNDFCFNLPEGVIGWAYACRDEKKLEIAPSQSEILCALAFDFTEGVFAYDCKTLTENPSYLEDAFCTLVVRATFYADENPPLPEDTADDAENRLSINDLLMIAEEGKTLDWSDFDGFRYEEIGSGLYIRSYPINEDFALYIGGASPEESPLYVRLVRLGEEETYLDLPGDILSFVEQNRSESRVPFENIMGMDGWYVNETNENFTIRTYYGTLSSVGAVIGESFGYSIYDTVKDLDGDGVTELICNCVSGGDGHRDVYVFRRKDGRVERGFIDLEQMELPGWNDWGVNSYATYYDADADTFCVSYDTEDGQKEVTTGLAAFAFEPFPQETTPNYYLTIPCENVATVVVTDRVTGNISSVAGTGLKKGDTVNLGELLGDSALENVTISGMNDLGELLFAYSLATEDTGIYAETDAGTKIPLAQVEVPAVPETQPLSVTYDRDDILFALHPTEATYIDGYGYYAWEDQAGIKEIFEKAVAHAESGEFDLTKAVSPVMLVYGYDWYFAFGDGTLRTYASGKGAKNVIPAEHAQKLRSYLSEVERMYGISPVSPKEITGIVKAELTIGDMTYTLTDGEKLKTIEQQFRSASLFGGMSKCPFTALLTFTTESEKLMTFALATDSCGAFLSDGYCYEYAGGNEQLFELFGITQNMLYDKTEKP